MIAVDVDPLPNRAPLFSRPSYVSLSNLEILLWCIEIHTFPNATYAVLFSVRSLPMRTSAAHFTSLQLTNLNSEV